MLPAIFQAWATDLVHGISVATYLDDFLIYGDSVGEVQETVREVLRRCTEAGYRVSAPKAGMCTDSIHALGRVVSHNRIAPDIGYLLQLEEVAYPRNLADLRSFLGALNNCAISFPGLLITAVKSAVAVDLSK